MKNPENWHKPRSHGNHLTDDEIAVIADGFRTRRPLVAVARELECSYRTILRHYAFFRDDGIAQARRWSA